MAQRQQVGVMRSRLQSGMPVDSLDALTVEINLMISHMMYSLEDERPKWAADLRKINDIQLLQALYEEVASHESIFHGYRTAETEG